jgi:polyribonucleotide nucleotidyltransferase
MVHTVSLELGSNTLSIETGKLAKQAGGAAYVRYGDSVVLATATSAHEGREGIDFFPLTVDYREYTYAAGRIPGGYIKREGRPSEKETLTSRLIDRPLRPLFEKGFKCETQVIAMVLSADSDNDPDVLGICGASAALMLSDIPFHNPIAAVRVGKVGGKLAVNPTHTERAGSALNITIAATEQAIVMVEAGATGASEDEVLEALLFGHEQCKRIIAKIKELRELAGVPKRPVEPPKKDEALYKEIAARWTARLEEALDTKKHPKMESGNLLRVLKKELLAEYAAKTVGDEAKTKETSKEVAKCLEHLREAIFRENILKKKQRPDHRAFDEVRNITCEVGLLPRTHGSAVFTRGETQALVTCTMGTKDDMQRQEKLEVTESFKRFMLNYNFPPFSVGEVQFLRGPGRREIGHGMLAERAVGMVLPDADKYPYTLRVVSDILESNGSSSMASVCGATLALLDAGVPLKANVAGIAMGLVMGEDGHAAILTDIAGAEDHYGDMDFKVAGTKDGITALQMDIKVGGVDPQLMRKALEQARKARLHILGIMEQTIATPRAEMSPFAPRIYTMKIPVDKIREVIGPGGKVIRGIVEQTGVKIDVEDDGSIHIASSDGPSAQKAIQIITDITATAEMGKTYLGKVVRIVDFGAFVEIFPGTDGLLHISEIAEHRVAKVRDELKEGDQILVKVINIEGNKVKLSRKALLRDQKAAPKKPAEPTE